MPELADGGAPRRCQRDVIIPDLDEPSPMQARQVRTEGAAAGGVPGEQPELGLRERIGVTQRERLEHLAFPGAEPGVSRYRTSADHDRCRALEDLLRVGGALVLADEFY